MKDKSIEILEEDKCSGCSACLVICPTNAISMHNNGEGFLYPKVNYTLCTNCGLCSKICPELEFYISPNNEIPEECYSMQSNDSIRMQGASGGMFALVANYILDIEYLLKENDRLDSCILNLKNQTNDLYNRTNDLYNISNDLYNRTNYLYKKNNDLKELTNYEFNILYSNQNWIKLFGIYNTNRYIYILFFGIKLILKVDEKQINKIAWWIPIKKWRDNFRAKFKRPDQTRPDQTRPDHEIISIDYLCYYNNLKHKKIQPMLQFKIAA